MKNIIASVVALVIICSMTSCGGKSESTDTTAKITTTTGQTITTEKTTTSETTTSTSAETTTTTTKATTTETTTTKTTTTAKQFDTSYYEFEYEKDIILKYDTSLYSAPDKSSEKLYDFSKDTILAAVGETSDWYAVIMNDDVVFCEKVSSKPYVTTVITYSTEYENVTEITTTEIYNEQETETEYIEPLKTYHTTEPLYGDGERFFHNPDCPLAEWQEDSGLMYTIFQLQTYSHMIKLGYTPCNQCNPT